MATLVSAAALIVINRRTIAFYRSHRLRSCCGSPGAPNCPKTVPFETWIDFKHSYCKHSYCNMDAGFAGCFLKFETGRQRTERGTAGVAISAEINGPAAITVALTGDVYVIRVPAVASGAWERRSGRIITVLDRRRRNLTTPDALARSVNYGLPPPASCSFSEFTHNCGSAFHLDARTLSVIAEPAIDAPVRPRPSDGTRYVNSACLTLDNTGGHVNMRFKSPQ